MEAWLRHANDEAAALGYAGFAARVARQLPAVAGIDRVVVYRVSPDGDRVITVDATPVSGDALQNTLLTLSSLPVFLRNALDGGRQVVMGELERSALPDAVRTTMRYKGVRSALYTPYLRGGGLGGFVTVEALRGPADFSDAVRAAASAIALTLSVLEADGAEFTDASLETSAALALLANLSERILRNNDAQATIAETLADLRMIYRDVSAQVIRTAEDPFIAGALATQTVAVRDEVDGVRVALPLRNPGAPAVLDAHFSIREVMPERMRVLRAVANLLGLAAAREQA